MQRSTLLKSKQFDPSRIEGPRFMVKITEISKTKKVIARISPSS